jgi:hypothetical protein
MESVKLEIKKMEEKASRLELFMRIIWMIPTYIVIVLFGIAVSICWPLQGLVILITGKRNGMLDSVLRKYFKYNTQISAYIILITDERNPIIPE